MLSIEHLTAGYGSKKVLDDISLTIEDGCVTALIGPNGSGKTTLIRAVSGVLPVMNGVITVDDRQVNTLPEQERARLISVVSQARRITPEFSTREGLALWRKPYIN